MLSTTFFRYLASASDCGFLNKMFAAFVDVSPEELQKQKELQSSLETVDVKRDSTDSESKEDTEQNVSYAAKLGKLLARSMIFI